jgi:hypothetical protein
MRLTFRPIARARLALIAAPIVLGVLGGLGLTACGNDNPKLMVTGIEPDKGDVEGGTTVRIKGNRFLNDTPRTAKVYFGGRPGVVSGYENDGVLVVQAPGGKPNEVVDVLIVFDPGGQLRIPNGFKFVEKSHSAPSVDDLNINRDSKDKK